jgi:hypothetical protein
MLKQVVGHAVAELGGAHALETQLVNGAAQLKARAWQEFESAYQALPATQKAVLDAVARHTPAFEAFAEVSMETYTRALGKPPTNSTIQGALDALREKELIWRAGRGDYAFEDDGLQDWYLENHPNTPVVETVGMQAKTALRPASKAKNNQPKR